MRVVSSRLKERIEALDEADESGQTRVELPDLENRWEYDSDDETWHGDVVNSTELRLSKLTLTRTDLRPDCDATRQARYDRFNGRRWHVSDKQERGACSANWS